MTIAYNLEGVDNLRLTGELIADIYMGKILKWNDARIAAVNSGKQLPDKEIYPVFRLDGSGTTYIFSDYLTKVSTDWKAKIGTGKSLDLSTWSSGYGKYGRGRLVGKVPGAIGYVASEYAASFNTQSAWLKNAAGNLCSPLRKALPLPQAWGCYGHDYRFRGCRRLSYQLLHMVVLYKSRTMLGVVAVKRKKS